MPRHFFGFVMPNEFDLGMDVGARGRLRVEPVGLCAEEGRKGGLFGLKKPRSRGPRVVAKPSDGPHTDIRDEGSF